MLCRIRLFLQQPGWLLRRRENHAVLKNSDFSAIFCNRVKMHRADLEWGASHIWLAWENSRRFTTPPRVSPRNDVWETSAEIPYWWRVITQIWEGLLIGKSKFLRGTTNQKHHYPDLGEIRAPELLIFTLSQGVDLLVVSLSLQLYRLLQCTQSALTVSFILLNNNYFSSVPIFLKSHCNVTLHGHCNSF